MIRSQTDADGRVVSNSFSAIARIHNVGPGPAISIELSMAYLGSFTLEGTSNVQPGFISTLLYGDIFSVTFTWETTEPALRADSFRPSEFSLEGRCHDASGRPHDLRHGFSS